MQRLEDLGNRLVTRKRARAYAVIATLVTAVQYAYGLTRAKGLLDGYGHVIGGDLLAFYGCASDAPRGPGPTALRLYASGKLPAPATRRGDRARPGPLLLPLS